MLAGLQNGGRKLGVIRRVCEVLGLKAEGVAAVINLASFAANAIQEVAGIKLKPRLGGRNFEQAS